VHPALHLSAGDKRDTWGSGGDKLFLFHIQGEFQGWDADLLRNGKKKRELHRVNLVSYLLLLATECLPAGDSSLRNYREMKPGKKTVSFFSPHPINFVINKSDSYRTACHICL
jgi:hypothetical protein